MAAQTLAEFMAKYDPDGTRVVIALDAVDMKDALGDSPLVVVRCGKYAAVIAVMEVAGYLDLDIHPFVDGQDAAAGVFGMTDGQRFTGFSGTGKTSQGWPATNMVAVLVGEQGEES